MTANPRTTKLMARAKLSLWREVPMQGGEGLGWTDSTGLLSSSLNSRTVEGPVPRLLAAQTHSLCSSLVSPTPGSPPGFAPGRGDHSGRGPATPTRCLFCGWNGKDAVLVCQTHSRRAMCPCLGRSSVWAGVLQPRPSAAPGGPGPPRGGPLSSRRPQCRRSQRDSRW